MYNSRLSIKQRFQRHHRRLQEVHARLLHTGQRSTNSGWSDMFSSTSEFWQDVTIQSSLTSSLVITDSPSVWPYNPATGFRPLSATVVSVEPFSHGTGTLRCLQKEMATYMQTLICVRVARPRRCLTLSNPVPWQNWMAAYLGYTLRLKTLFRGWPVMAHETYTRKRRSAEVLRGLLHLVQRGEDWAGPQPAQAPPRCTKCNSSPINGQCTNHRIAV